MPAEVFAEHGVSAAGKPVDDHHLSLAVDDPIFRDLGCGVIDQLLFVIASGLSSQTCKCDLKISPICSLSLFDRDPNGVWAP